MKQLFFIMLCFLTSTAMQAQVEAEKELRQAVKEFHEGLVKNSFSVIDRRTTSSLGYGHSNGWIESKAEMIKNLETGYMDYHSISEDSMSIVIDNNAAQVRFITDIDVTRNSSRGWYHLKVLEVWVKEKDQWKLFARQAVK